MNCFCSESPTFPFHEKQFSEVSQNITQPLDHTILDSNSSSTSQWTLASYLTYFSPFCNPQIGVNKTRLKESTHIKCLHSTWYMVSNEWVLLGVNTTTTSHHHHHHHHHHGTLFFLLNMLVFLNWPGTIFSVFLLSLPPNSFRHTMGV